MVNYIKCNSFNLGHLKTNHDFKFLLTRRLNTDRLENFFGTIRQQGGGGGGGVVGDSDNPTPAQFSSAFRKLFFSSFLTSSAGNCDADFDNLRASFGKTSIAKPLISTPTEPQTLEIGPTDYTESNIDSNIAKENALAYVAGYLLHKSMKIHTCPTCTDAVQCKNLDDNRKLFCYFKAFDQTQDSFGGLHAPTHCFLDYVIQLEDTFFKHFSVYNKSLSVGASILKLLKNRDLSSTKKKDRKYIKVAHL